MAKTGFTSGAVFGLIKESVLSFIDDDALSKGASIAFYTVTSIAPVLVIIIAIAGLAFGHDAAQGAITAQLSGMMGQQSAEILQAGIKSASGKSAGIIGSIVGFLTLLITASGVFGEMQSALNTIWKTKSQGGTITRLLRARAASLGLVAALGFLLLVSLVVSALLTAFGTYVNDFLPFGQLVLSVMNFVISFFLITVLFAAIYKVLPDTRIEWRDVLVGSIVTALLFIVGKSLIGMYIGSTAIGSSYGAAGGLVVLLLWIYYSAQVFLLGAEFTKVYASRQGSKQNTAGAVEQAGAARDPKHTNRPTETLSPVTYMIATVVILLSQMKKPRR